VPKKERGVKVRAGLLVSGAAALGMVVLGAASADSITVDFEAPTYSVGNINGQDGWSKTGPYDAAVVSNTYGYASFGAQSLRISNAVTSGSFGDHAFSKPLADEAGETTAAGDGMSGGTRQAYFEASWDFASTVPGSEQAGLSVVASPDRGDGARMTWVQMADAPGGLSVNFYDYQDGAVEPAGTCSTGDNFVFTAVASGLDRTVPHNVRITMEFVDGPGNDIVKVYVDGVLLHTGTSWEDYFRYCEGNPSRTVDSMLFRTGGAAAPATLGNGFLIDNLVQTSGPVPPALVGPPTSRDACKKGGWETFNFPRAFKNQGDCIQFFNTGK
jgi:hypothetical protein